MLIDPVLEIVVVLQVYLFVRCLLHARGNDAAALDGLRKQFNDDIVRRANRGDGPDWVRYMDEADRVHDQRVSRLQAWATAALVVGIGGTMAALAWRLFGTSLERPEELIDAVGPALLASLLGVVNNLIITLGLFHRSDVRFRSSLDEFRHQLQEFSDENLPHEKFANAVRDQLGNAFKEAVRTFPEAFTRLDESVKSLGEVIEAQSNAVLKAAGGLKQGADSLTLAAKEIVPVAELLKLSTDRLRTLPEELKQAIQEAHKIWEQKIRQDQDSFIAGVLRVLQGQKALLEDAKDKFIECEHQRSEVARQQAEKWNEAIQSIQKSELAIVKTVEGLPATFSYEVEKIADRLGKQFGLEARQHIQHLVNSIRDGNEILRTQIESAVVRLQTVFLNETSKVVAETLDEVFRQVEGTLLKQLAEIGEDLKRALKELPDHAQSFASSLSTADEKLQLTIGRIAEATNHLEQVAKLTEKFEKLLADALTKAVAPSVESLQSEVGRIVKHLQSLKRPIEVRHTPKGSVREFTRKLFGIFSFGRKGGKSS